MEKATFYPDIQLIGIIDSVMLATAQEFSRLIEKTIKANKENLNQNNVTNDHISDNKIGEKIVKLVLWSQHTSYVFIIDSLEPFTLLEHEFPSNGSINESDWNQASIIFSFDVKNVIRSMMINSTNLTDITSDNEERNFVAILVLDVVHNLSKLVILECDDYEKLGKFYNDLNLSLLNMEVNEDLNFPAISSAAIDDKNETTIESVSYENIDKLQYVVVLEMFENVEGYYSQVVRDKSTFKLNRNCYRKVRISFVNTNEQQHDFTFHECEKFVIKLQNENIITMINIELVFGRDNERSFYLLADWSVDDEGLFNLIDNDENKKIPIQLNLYLMSKLVSSIFVYSFDIEIIYKTLLDRIRPSFFSYPLVYRLALKIHLNDDRLISDSCASLSLISKLTISEQSNLSTSNPIIKSQIGNRLALLFGTKPKNFIGNIISNNNDSDEEAVFTGNYETSYSRIPSHVRKEWAIIFEKWFQTKTIPMNAMNLIKTYGIYPEIRNKFWLLQSGAYEKLDELTTVYNDLVNLDSEYEKIISWDVRRTFPTHLFFKNGSGPGQNALYNVCKVYSIYDPQVGYCQGMSFIVATILLVANEVETFAIIVQIMQKYSQRDIYMENFHLLQLEFFIFERLLHKFCSELYNHLKNCSIEYHMFLTQWILTMFTAKFPLSMAFLVIDFFLIDGRHALIKVCIALLMISKHEILQMNFDDILKYFRVNLPKLYVSKANYQNLIKVAQDLDINEEDVDILIHDYNRQNNDTTDPHDPTQHLKTEKNVLFNRLIRMEIENDILARELIKHQLKNEKQVASLEQIIEDKDTEIQCMLYEIENCHKLIHKFSTEEIIVKESLRNVIKESDKRESTDVKIIEHYKSFCTILEGRLSKLEDCNKSFISELHKHRNDCNNCNKLLNSISNNHDKQGIDNQSSNDYCDKNSPENRIKALEHEVISAKTALADASNTINELLQKITDLKIDARTPWFKKFTANLRK